MYVAKKKLMVVAASIACGLPLAAQAQEASNIQVYGKLYPEITSYSVSGGTSAGTPVSTLVKNSTAGAATTLTSMDSSNTYFGFRGSEDLGGGLRAIYQLEGGFGIDDGTLPKSGVLFSRDTFVGLSGSFGTLKLGGNMDTVYKKLYDQIGFFGLSSGNFNSASNIVSQGGFGSSNAERFHERPANTILYQSPKVNGFTGLFGYSLGEVAGNVSSHSNTSAGVKYEAGPVYLALAHEEHIGLFGGSSNLTALPGLSNLSASGTPLAGTNSHDQSTRVTAKYDLPTDTRVEVDVASTKLSESGGQSGHFQSYQHNSWLLSADQKLGPWTLAGSYGGSAAGSCELVGGAACNTGGLDAKMLSLGVSYSLSKRTMLFAFYSKLNNGYSANIDNASSIAASSVSAGQSIREAAMGLSHTF
jgi:predicted porin